jgi:hypothetical protein
MDVQVGLRCRGRSDFPRMLRQLGAISGVNYCQFDAETGEILDIQHVYLRCHYEQWTQAFGEPEMVSPRLDVTVGAIVRTWQHHYVDGSVTCIGYMFEHPTGVRWVIVVRVCFS